MRIEFLFLLETQPLEIIYTQIRQNSKRRRLLGCNIYNTYRNAEGEPEPKKKIKKRKRTAAKERKTGAVIHAQSGRHFWTNQEAKCGKVAVGILIYIYIHAWPASIPGRKGRIAVCYLYIELVWEEFFEGIIDFE